MSRHSLQASAAAALIVACAAAGAAALSIQSLLHLSPLYPAKAAAAVGAAAWLAFRHVTRHHPFDRFGPANQVTAVRLALFALLTALVGERPLSSIASGVVAVSVLATALDGVDGWLARRFRTASAFGARFDMEVDAALIQVLAILVWQHGKAGPWILAAGLLRYVFVAAGWLLPWMRGPLTPSLRGRAVCVIQIVALIVAMTPIVPPDASRVIAAAGLAALTWSFAVDTGRLWRYAAAGRTP